MVQANSPDTPAGIHEDLTPTERRLLETLRGEPGRVFSRKELIALVMPGTVVLERTIDVHIRGLRKKLGRDVARIRTIRRRGYRYDPAGERSSPS